MSSLGPSKGASSSISLSIWGKYSKYAKFAESPPKSSTTKRSQTIPKSLSLSTMLNLGRVIKTPSNHLMSLMLIMWAWSKPDVVFIFREIEFCVGCDKWVWSKPEVAFIPGEIECRGGCDIWTWSKPEVVSIFRKIECRGGCGM